jgi:hypothetical protein
MLLLSLVSVSASSRGQRAPTVSRGTAPPASILRNIHPRPLCCIRLPSIWLKLRSFTYGSGRSGISAAVSGNTRSAKGRPALRIDIPLHGRALCERVQLPRDGERNAQPRCSGPGSMTLRKKRLSGPDQRKSARRPLRYPARIDAGNGSPPAACIILDISQTGAKLFATSAPDTPDEFALRLGAAARKCRVVWRKERQIGVQFLAPA